MIWFELAILYIIGENENSFLEKVHTEVLFSKLIEYIQGTKTAPEYILIPN